MHILRLWTLLLSVVTLAACDDRPQVHVFFTSTVNELSAVRVSGQVGQGSSDVALPAVLKPTTQTSSFGELVLRLPADAHGMLQVQLDGLKPGNCLIAQGTGSMEVSAAVATGLTIVLGPVSQGCHVSVHTSGPGAVVSTQRTADGQPLMCHGDCVAEFRPELDVRLSPVPDADTYFLGWDGACSGVGECVIHVQDGLAQVTARFTSARVCTRSELCWDHPQPTGATLRAAWTSPSGSVWIVGDGGTILRNDVGFFYQVPIEVSTTLTDLWGSSDRDIWVVGTCSVVRHWDGVVWQKNSPYASESCLTAPVVRFIWGDGNGGIWLGDEAQQLFFFDGQSWNKRTPPFRFAVGRAHGTGPTNVWFAADAPVIYHWDGAAFTYKLLPALSGSPTAVHAVTSDDVWVGTNTGKIYHVKQGVLNEERPLSVSPEITAIWGATEDQLWAFNSSGQVWRRNKTDWIPQPSPSGERQIFGVSGRNPDDLWAVGAAGILSHWNGALWVETGDQFRFSELRVHGGGSDDVWFSSLPNLAYHRVGGALLQSNSIPPPTGLFAFGGHAWVSTLYGTLQLVDAPLSQTCPSPGARSLAGVHGSDDKNVWAVGRQGLLMKYDPPVCTAYQLADAMGANPDLYGVWVRNPDELWVAGDNLITRIIKGTPTLYPVTGKFRRISGASLDSIWAVGENAALYWFDGTSWTPFTISPFGFPITSNFNDVWAASPDEAWIVGDGNIIFHERRNPATGVWQPKFSSADVVTDFTGVWGSKPDDVWIAGRQGEILRYHPSSP